MYGFIQNFSTITPQDLDNVGSKNVMLANLYNKANPIGLLVPNGFAVTYNAYNHFFAYNNLPEKLAVVLSQLDLVNLENLAEISAKCKRLICSAKFPRELEAGITREYYLNFQNDQEVAVRSSAIESGQKVQEYGRFESFFGVKGAIALNYAVKCSFASYYNENALRYRIKNNIELTYGGIAVAVQKMVRAETSCSGNVILGAQDADKKELVRIESIPGLGSGFSIDDLEPDVIVAEYAHEKQNDPAILIKKMGSKKRMITKSDSPAGINTTEIKLTPPELRDVFLLNNHEIKLLTGLLKSVKKLFPGAKGFLWAKDNGTDNIFVTDVIFSNNLGASKGNTTAFNLTSL